MKTPEFDDKDKFIEWVVSNKSAIIAQKKSAIKHADAVNYQIGYITEKSDEVIKSELIPDDATRLKVRAIINTTKIFDSHDDVHVDQLWNKSLKETKDNYLCKEHNFSFDGIISDNVKAFAKQMSWKELGFNYEGNTQALIYDCVIDRKTMPDMFDRYRSGKIKQHSVAMRYVKIELAVNSDQYEKEYETWNKYFELIVNKEDALERGLFWAVTEAKNIEGSAVLRGSNRFTPTQSIEQIKDEPPIGTHKTKPENSTLIKLMENYSPIKHI